MPVIIYFKDILVTVTVTGLLFVVPKELLATHTYEPASEEAALEILRVVSTIVPPEYLLGLELELIVAPDFVQEKLVMLGLALTLQVRIMVSPGLLVTVALVTVSRGASETCVINVCCYVVI